MPHGIPDFPWSGKRITAEYLGRAKETPVSFTLSDYCDEGSQSPAALGYSGHPSCEAVKEGPARFLCGQLFEDVPRARDEIGSAVPRGPSAVAECGPAQAWNRRRCHSSGIESCLGSGLALSQ